jgi:LysM repeat protein
MSYAVWFKHNKTIYKLPVNPEEIEITSSLAIEKYNVLKLGQIAVPANMELSEYSFEAELPHTTYHYVDISEDEFENADYYLSQFKSWRDALEPVQFIAASSEEDTGFMESINVPVLIEELTITEKAGEERDKYIKLKLLEYKSYSKKPAEEIIFIMSVSGSTTVKKQAKTATEAVSTKSSGYYVVQSGDSLYSIAKKLYGDGSKCNIIYNANKDKIKNPGLISAGWKLKIPAANEFSKYSAALPTSKTSTVISVGRTSVTQTAYEQGVQTISRGAGRVKDPDGVRGAGRNSSVKGGGGRTSGGGAGRNS